MVSAGYGAMDTVRQVVSVLGGYIRKRKSALESASDGFLIKLHYQWTFYFMMLLFTVISCSWYWKEHITCVSLTNAEAQMRMDYLNLCLSYPYRDTLSKSRDYIAYYRWLGWLILIIAGLYCIPRKIIKRSDSHKLRRVFRTLTMNDRRYDFVDAQSIQVCIHYLLSRLNSHNSVYFKHLACTFVALFIDIFVYFSLDFALKGHFVNYGYMVMPFQRDPEGYTDFMSRAFPPFVKCTISENHKLMAKRNENYGCHLPYMELYEKIFLVLWFWLVFLILATAAYLIFLFLFMALPYFQVWLLDTKKYKGSDKNFVKDTIIKTLNYCQIGDAFLLYKIKQKMTDAKFIEMLSIFVEEKTAAEERNRKDSTTNSQNSSFTYREQKSLLIE